MMDANDLAKFSQFMIGLLGLWFLYWWCVRRYCRDKFRNDLFAMRDRLFDLAATVPDGFKDPGYQYLRTTFNGFIRMADKVTPAHVFMGWLLATIEGEEESHDPYASSKMKGYLLEAKTELGKRVVRHVFLGHPFIGSVAWVVFWAARLCIWTIAWLRSRWKRPNPTNSTRPFRCVMIEAHNIGKLKHIPRNNWIGRLSIDDSSHLTLTN
jgi:hypothetical protein